MQEQFPTSTRRMDDIDWTPGGWIYQPSDDERMLFATLVDALAWAWADRENTDDRA